MTESDKIMDIMSNNGFSMNSFATTPTCECGGTGCQTEVTKEKKRDKKGRKVVVIKEVHHHYHFGSYIYPYTYPQFPYITYNGYDGKTIPCNTWYSISGSAA